MLLDNDELPNLISQIAQKEIQGEIWASYGIVQSYNPLSHKCSVLLMPDQTLTPELPILMAFRGAAHPIQAGQQVYVGMIRGRPQIVLGMVARDGDQISTFAAVFEGDIGIIGNVVSSGFQLMKVYALPPATPDQRGRHVFLSTSNDGEAGDPDGEYICLQDAAGTLYWKLVVEG